MTPDLLIAHVRQMLDLQLKCGATDTTRGLVLKHGLGWRCRRNRWPGIRRGPLKQCFKNASAMAVFDERWIYCEGFAIRYALDIALGEHAWVLDAANNCEVVDPTWRDTKDGLYLGIPFSQTYLQNHLMDRGYYGVLVTHDWSVPALFRQPVEEWLHPDAATIPRDFVA
jgi:hypothetical protein